MKFDLTDDKEYIIIDKGELEEELISIKKFLLGKNAQDKYNIISAYAHFINDINFKTMLSNKYEKLYDTLYK